MKEYNFFESTGEEIAIALGFFDSMHFGHKTLARKVLELSKRFGWKSAVFTFKNNANIALNKSCKLVLTYDERVEMLKLLNIDLVLSTVFDDNFLNLTAEEFLNMLSSKHDVKAIVCGEDYSYGKNACGNVESLKAFCDSNNIELYTVPFFKHDNQKVATSQVRNLIENGNIQEANELLGYKFFINGIVEEGYKVGRTIGFPTLNIKYPIDKVAVKNGVYLSIVEIENKQYYGISNVGSRPTFGDFEMKVETYVLNFNKEIYGERIKVSFVKFMRETVKFNSKEELKEVLEKDKISLLKEIENISD